MTSRIDLIQGLFRAIERGEPAEVLRGFFHPDARQIEHPSLLRPSGGSRDLDAMLAGAEAGRALIADQRYEPLAWVDDGSRVAVQFVWSGTLLTSVGDRPAGTTLRAQVAAFYEFRDGLILTQTSYDCYEPTPA